MIEIAPGMWIAPEHVAVVRDAGRGKCQMFTVGQSAVDEGFLIEEDAEAVVEDIENAKEEDRGQRKEE